MAWRPPPPLLAFGALAVAYLVHLAGPTPPLLPSPWNLAGLAPVVGGVALAAAAGGRFRTRATTVHPWRVPSALVIEGPYAWTRNPMYLGLALGTLGLALLVGTAPMLLAPALFVLAMDRYVIPWEERTLEATFGEAYQRYKARVGRWF